VVELKELTATEFRTFQQFIYEMSGIRIPATKRTLLSNRVRRRLKAGGFDDFQSYFRHLRSTPGQGELAGFLDAVTTNETYFFRTEKHFEWFRSEFINQLVLQARRGERPRALKIWSAACSTGEEPYSIAICLAENRLRLRDWRLEIVATDLSEDALRSARTGLYQERALRGLDERRRRRHLAKRQDEPLWEIKPHVRELVSFQQHNLMHAPPEGPFDCVFVRNVLIYFDRQSKQRVVGNLVAAMADGGYLVVGPSEGIYDMLQDLTKHSTFLYQK
jgi:chemotaxis protein methyltransferase CheR